MVYLWNMISIYFLIAITIGIDTLFLWLVSNICAQYHVLFHRFKSVGQRSYINSTESIREINKCLNYHSEVLKLLRKLNRAYGIIIFLKFIISCSQICCLVFRLSHPYNSLGVAVYQTIFLLSVAIQLMLYCYNGQKIKDMVSEHIRQTLCNQKIMRFRLSIYNLIANDKIFFKFNSI